MTKRNFISSDIPSPKLNYSKCLQFISAIIHTFPLTMGFKYKWMLTETPIVRALKLFLRARIPSVENRKITQIINLQNAISTAACFTVPSLFLLKYTWDIKSYWHCKWMLSTRNDELRIIPKGFRFLWFFEQLNQLFLLSIFWGLALLS